ncbi:uncharacterized protein EI90DRAFT_2998980 [Cantharellus anzutake]|uniref:uncharacterized protein n=1 Tax=Cantharellus anzutake TaxID=1750568 RepID=UPI001908A345|nr:uncharacterized protein EI90DRAFT_2998980 [Cantharellus anzutake]KAF8326834.1 hypothetical protein EI90DRAFT_2998980 [Cantharellus anzutake]
MIARVLILVIAALHTQFVFAFTCTRNYTVIKGDTCDAISQTHNVSTYQLAVLNPTINSGCTNLEISQCLCLGSSQADCTKTYTVSVGDYCQKISDEFGLSGAMLYANNPYISAVCDNIDIGQVLCVDKAYNVPPLQPNQPKPSIDPTPKKEVYPPKPTSDDDLPWCKDGEDEWE